MISFISIIHSTLNNKSFTPNPKLNNKPSTASEPTPNLIDLDSHIKHSDEQHSSPEASGGSETKEKVAQ